MSEKTNCLRVFDGFMKLCEVLAPFVASSLETKYQQNWWKKGVLEAVYRYKKHLPETGDRKYLVSKLDLRMCLKLIDYHWRPLFSSLMDKDQRSFVKELESFANRIAHIGLEDISYDDTWRALDTMCRISICTDTSVTMELRDRANAIRDEAAAGASKSDIISGSQPTGGVTPDEYFKQGPMPFPINLADRRCDHCGEGPLMVMGGGDGEDLGLGHESVSDFVYCECDRCGETAYIDVMTFNNGPDYWAKMEHGLS